MTQKKQVAKTIKTLIHGDTFAQVLDRSSNVDDILGTLSDHWSFSLEDRRPGPALYDERSGLMQATDLDLASLLGTLLARNAPVVLPDYKAAGGGGGGSSTQQATSKSRVGQLRDIVSNKELFSFSIRIQDQTILDTSTGKLGAPRTFHVLGRDGEWHPTYTGIDFAPDSDEAKFIKDFALSTRGSLVFDDFVSKHRWGSFLGQYYILSKTLLQRLQEERDVRADQAKGATASASGGGYVPEDEDSSGPKLRKERVDAPVFEARVEAPYVGLFPAMTPDEAKARAHALQYKIIPALQFPLRATEYAYYRRLGEGLTAGASGPEVDNAVGITPWMKGVKFETSVEGRTPWRRLVLGQLVPGQKGIALSYRIRAKKVEVARV